MMKHTRRSVLAAGSAVAAAGLLPRFSIAAAGAPVRLTSVKFGSVSWLIETIRAEGIDKKRDLDLQIVEVANNPAAPVALLSGAADVIVSDWTWALRQRAKGGDQRIVPLVEAGERRVFGDRPVKKVQRFTQSLLRSLAQVVPPLQVQVMGGKMADRMLATHSIRAPA